MAKNSGSISNPLVRRRKTSIPTLKSDPLPDKKQTLRDATRVSPKKLKKLIKYQPCYPFDRFYTAHEALMDRKINTTVDRLQGGQTYYGTPPPIKNVTYLGFGSADIGSCGEQISVEFPKKIITDYIRRNFSSADPNEPLEHQFMCIWQIEKLLKRDVPVYKYRYLRQDFIQTGSGDSSSNFSCTVTIPSLSVWEHHGLLVPNVHPWGTMRVILHRAVFNISLPHVPGKPSLVADQPEARIENGVKVYEAEKGSSFRCIVNDTFPGFPEPEVTWWTQDKDGGGDDKPGWSGSSVGIELNFIGSPSGWVWCEVSNSHGASRSDLIKIVNAPKGFREFPRMDFHEIQAKLDNDMRKSFGQLNSPLLKNWDFYSVPIIRAVRFVPAKRSKTTFAE
ncbi:hypothetical protein RvY_13061 [Ramazzottius varieornatus]|uniref:Ig-like domain-containing protein n=1 Tax=Ramazzottius varieornatus TaxID=947166 RepID=A0A1D1VU75_RAMVA|nr:hypothetical protein RvY_13061 [Ramazzottius varieornatus]